MSAPSTTKGNQAASSDANLHNTRSTPSHYIGLPRTDTAIAPLVEPESQTHNVQSPTRTEDRPKSSEELSLQLLRSSGPLPAIQTIIPGASLPSKIDLPGRHTMPRSRQLSMLSTKSIPNSWQVFHLNCDSELKSRLSAPPDLTSLSSSNHLQSPKVSRPLGGIQNPAKQISDDIRQQCIATIIPQHYPLRSGQAGCMPSLVVAAQPSFMHYIGYPPQVPSRTSSIGFNAPFGPGIRRKSAADVPVCNSTTGLVPFYPRPGSWRAPPDLDRIHSRYATQLGSSSQPRILSNPYKSTISENLELEGQDTNPHLSPEYLNRLEASRANEQRTFFDNALSNRKPNQHSKHIIPQVSSSFSPGYQDQRPNDCHKSSQWSKRNPRTAREGPSLPFIHQHDPYPSSFAQWGPQSMHLTQKESEPFPLQSTNFETRDQNPPQSRHGGRRSSDQYLPRNRHNRRSSLHQEQQQAQRLLLPSDNCALFVTGLPCHIEAKTLWDMFSCVRGLKWIASPQKMPVGKGYSFSKIV